MSIAVPPGPNDVEVSLFGPGVGECVVVHTGNGEWLVIDSCLDGVGSASEPVALRYFRQLGIEPATAIRLVVVTHWHDDHIRGIAEVYRRAQAADVVFSMAVNSEQFLLITREAKALAGMDPSSVDEFSGVISELMQRQPAGARTRLPVPIYAVARLPVSGASTTARVTALSPSQFSVQKSQVALCERLRGMVHGGRRLVAQEPNETAVALWVEAGTRRILLGSDLENSTDSREGWSAVVTDAHADGRSDADVFKVSHHGSANGHHPDVWSKLLTPGVSAVLSPFRRSGLPKKGDLHRLRSATGDVFLTAPVAAPRPRKRGTAVEAQLNAFTQRRRAVRGGKPGHVRLRMSRTGGPIAVELFDGAHKVG